MESLTEWVGVRTFFIVILAAGLTAYLIYRSVKNKKLTTFYSVAMALILILNTYSEYRLFETQIIGSKISAEISDNKKSHLKCQRFSEAFFDAQTFTKGFVSYAKPNTALMKYQLCKDLQSFFSSNKSQPTEQQTLALAILIHEAVHTGGEFSEAITECVTHKLYIPTAVKLGTPPLVAEQMLSTYQQVYHANQAQKYQYSEGDCDEHYLLPEQPE